MCYRNVNLTQEGEKTDLVRSLYALVGTDEEFNARFRRNLIILGIGFAAVIFILIPQTRAEEKKIQRPAAARAFNSSRGRRTNRQSHSEDEGARQVQEGLAPNTRGRNDN